MGISKIGAAAQPFNAERLKWAIDGEKTGQLPEQGNQVKKPAFLGYTVPTAPVKGPERTGVVGQPKRVEGETGESIAYTNNQGYVGLANEPASALNNSAGRRERWDFVPRTIAVA